MKRKRSASAGDLASFYENVYLREIDRLNRSLLLEIRTLVGSVPGKEIVLKYNNIGVRATADGEIGFVERLRMRNGHILVVFGGRPEPVPVREVSFLDFGALCGSVLSSTRLSPDIQAAVEVVVGQTVVYPDCMATPVVLKRFVGRRNRILSGNCDTYVFEDQDGKERDYTKKALFELRRCLLDK